MTLPPEPDPGPSLRSRALSALAVAGLAVVAVMVAIAGAFVHRWANPAGLFLAIGGAVSLGILARVCARSRFGLAVIAMLWLVPVFILAQPPWGSEDVIRNDEFGLVFLFGGTVGLAVVLGRGVEARSTRRVT